MSSQSHEDDYGGWVDAQDRAGEMHDEAARFEVVGELYYRRTGRMRPYKAEPLASGHDSMSKENLARFELWMQRDAFWDAVDYIVKLKAGIESEGL
jgi:hypothetical protein